VIPVQILQFATIPNRPGACLEALQFRADSQALAAVWRTEQNILDVCGWDLPQGTVTASDLGATLGEDDATPPLPALSPDHRFLARMENHRGGEQYLRLIDRSKRKVWRELTAWEHDDEGYNYQYFVALAFSPSGEHLFVAVAGGDIEDATIDAHRIGVFRWTVERLLKGRGAKSDSQFLPDPDCFHLMPRPDVFDWARFGHPFVVAPDGSALAAGFWNDRVLSWDLTSGAARPELKLKKRKEPTAWRLAFAPDGRTLAVADETVTLHDVASGKAQVTLPPGPVFKHESLKRRPLVFDVAFDPSGRLLATANGDSIVRLHDAQTGTERETYDWGVGNITAVAFSPDGHLCAAGGQHGQVVVWDV
jgi:WD40 repeat protein